MPSISAALVCATTLWVVGLISAFHDIPKRPTGVAWVVTASDKMTTRPMLVRVHVPYRNASANWGRLD